MRSAALITALALLAPGSAQETIRVTTRLVQVNVVVTGNGGRPAAGLAREDFELLDEGRPQEIRTFLAQAAGITRRASEPLPVN
ncbi:MAG TPA: hypothetical protein VN428_09510, partial [Bryobacteraceae bacterium]|nr:hypothetical protein [Bryobacteraceae bacterium]